MHCCDEMRTAVSDEANSIVFVPKFREYGIRVLDGGTSYLVIKYCPWSGAKLPESKRAEWFDAIERLGLDPINEESIPEQFKTANWYRQSSDDASV